MAAARPMTGRVVRLAILMVIIPSISKADLNVQATCKHKVYCGYVFRMSIQKT
jgi:hypothetical protein